MEYSIKRLDLESLHTAIYLRRFPLKYRNIPKHMTLVQMSVYHKERVMSFSESLEFKHQIDYNKCIKNIHSHSGCSLVLNAKCPYRHSLSCGQDGIGILFTLASLLEKGDIRFMFQSCQQVLSTEKPLRQHTQKGSDE